MTGLKSLLDCWSSTTRKDAACDDTGADHCG